MTTPSVQTHPTPNANPNLKPTAIAQRIENTFQEHGFSIIAYFSVHDHVRFILATSEREGYDILLQIPASMPFQSVKAHSLCQIELQPVSTEWIKQEGEQGEIDVKYMSRNMKTLLENIDQNVKAHPRIMRLKLSWFDPVRKLLFTEPIQREGSQPKRFVIRDMARCPEWLATQPNVWFFTDLDHLFTTGFSLWDQSVLTGQWLRNTAWDEQKRLWNAMNKNWKSLLGARLISAHAPHPFTANFLARSERIELGQAELIKLRRMYVRDQDNAQLEKMILSCGKLILKLHRNVIAGLLSWSDVTDEWLTFFPSFQFTLNIATKYSADESKNQGTSIRARASDAVNSVLQWLEGGQGDSTTAVVEEEDASVDDDDHDITLPPVRTKSGSNQPSNLIIPSERPLPHRLAKLRHYDDSDDEQVRPPRPLSSKKSVVPLLAPSIRPVSVSSSDDEEPENEQDEGDDLQTGIEDDRDPSSSHPASTASLPPLFPNKPNLHIRTARKTPSYFEREVAKLEQDDHNSDSDS